MCDAIARGSAQLPDDRFASIDELLAGLAAAPSRRRAFLAIPFALAGVAAIATAVAIGASTSKSSKSPVIHTTNAMLVSIPIDAAQLRRRYQRRPSRSLRYRSRRTSYWRWSSRTRPST